VCEPPSFSLITGSGGNSHCSMKLEVPLILVRNDGMIYSTGQKYTYNVEPIPLGRAGARGVFD
jgi:hypothetical protein